MLNDTSFSLPVRVIFGCKSIEKLPEILGEKKRVLLVSDRVMDEIGTLDSIEEILTREGVEVVRYLEVETNPPMNLVDSGAEIYREKECQALISVGGGSAIDTAKAIGCVVENGGQAGDYEGFQKEIKNKPSFHVAIPTTAGTGSEVTPLACLTNPEEKYKWHIVSDLISPDIALLDPELITSMPEWLAAATGMDALTHAAEAYISLENNPYSDLFARGAISLIGRNIRAFVANRNDIDAAGAMLMGSNMAGVAFTHSCVTAVHALTGTVGGQFGMHHGVACAVLLPVVLRYNALADRGRYRDIMGMLEPCRDLSDFDRYELPEYIENLSSELGLPRDFGDIACTGQQADEICHFALNEYSCHVNPRKVTKKAVRDMLAEVFSMEE